MCINSIGHIFADFCGAGIIRSEDNGNTWIQTGSLLGGSRSIAFSENSGSLFAGTTDGLFKSLNNGADWSETTLTQLGIPCLFVDTQGYIYAGDYEGNIYKSIDDGQNWDKYLIANVGKVTDITQDISGLLFVSILVGGVYQSEDSGNTWIELNAGLHNTEVYSLIFDGGSDLYVGTYGNGVFKLDKSNNQWDSFNNGLTNLNVLSLAIDSEKYIYVGTDGGGVFSNREATTSVSYDEEVPMNFKLSQNYPNPFNPKTIIYYSLPNEVAVTITVYDILGKEINQLISQKQPSGKHSIQWNGTDHDGNLVGTGIYFYQIQAGDFIQTKKMVLTK